MSKKLITTVSCLLLASATLCQAQTRYQRLSYQANNPFAETFGVKRYDHASTFQQSVLDGMANLVGARAQANYYHNLAQLTNERVRQALMKNRAAKIEGNYEKNKKRAEYYAKRREQNRLRKEARQASRSALAATSHKQPNIVWPNALKADRYASQRKQIESLWQLKAQLGPTACESVKVGIRHGLRGLAKKIMHDENSGQLEHLQSLDVRKFVRVLYQNAGQPARTNSELIAMK